MNILFLLFSQKFEWTKSRQAHREIRRRTQTKGGAISAQRPLWIRMRCRWRRTTLFPVDAMQCESCTFGRPRSVLDVLEALCLLRLLWQWWRRIAAVRMQRRTDEICWTKMVTPSFTIAGSSNSASPPSRQKVLIRTRFILAPIHRPRRINTRGGYRIITWCEPFNNNNIKSISGGVGGEYSKVKTLIAVSNFEGRGHVPGIIFPQQCGV